MSTSVPPNFPPQNYFILGGNGLVGAHIVKALLSRGEKLVSVYSRSRPDRAKALAGVTYFSGDILEEEKLVDCMRKSGTTVLFHTVSPHSELNSDVYHKVNVLGTRTVLSACRTAGVQVLVFTSSIGVVWSGQTLCGVTEDEVKIPEEPYDLYFHTKGIAETMVLDANGTEGMKTVALRPCGIIGPGDRNGMWRVANAYTNGHHHFQMGNNTNRVSYCSATDVADAHLLAADKLCQPTIAGVAGEAFFITDGCPALFYDYPRSVWQELGAPRDSFVIVLPQWLCFTLAFFAEKWCSLFGGHTLFTRFLVTYATTEQWYSIDKAKRLLGYEPRVPLEEAVRQLVKWWKEEGSLEDTDTRIESQKQK